MATSTTRTNKPILPRGNDQSPLAYNRAKLFSGKALDFDGVNDYVDCGTLDVTAYTAISISTKLKLANITDNLRFVSLLHSGIDDVRIVQDYDTILFTLDDGTSRSVETPTLKVDEWNKLDMTFDGTTLKGYLNGVSIGSIAASFDFSTASGLLTLFKHSAASQYAEGAMSGFKLFNTALTAAQVADLYNNPEKVVPTGVDNTALKLWLPMQEGAGTTAYDGSPSGFVEDIVTGFTNGTTYPLDSFASSGDDITTAIKTNGFGGCVSNGHYYTNGQKVKVKFTYQKNSGDDLRVLFSSVVTGAGIAKSDVQYISASGEFEHTFTMTDDGIAYLQLGTGNAAHSIDAVITDVYVSPNVSANHGTISGATYTHGIGAPVAQTAVIDWNKELNLAPYSEDFTQSAYSKTGVVLTANNIVSPNGLTTGTKVAMNQDAESGVRLFTPMNAGAYTMNYFAKAGTITNAKFYQIEQGVAIRYMDVDLANGTISNVPSAWDNASIKDAGDGWYLLSVTNTMDAYHSGHGYGLVVSNENGNYFYLWGFHHKEAATLESYVPNFTASSLTTPVLLPQGLTSGRDITGVNLFENVRKQGALNLDGNSWAEVHDNESLDFGTGEFTMEVWAKLAYENTGSSYNGVIGLGGSLSTGATAYIYTRSAGPRFFINGTSFTIATTLDEGNWHHLVVTRTDAGAIQTYYDGAEGEDSGSEASTMTNAFDVLIGRDSGGSRYYQDAIAQPRIYNRALTAEEVQRNYNAGKNIYTNS